MRDIRAGGGPKPKPIANITRGAQPKPPKPRTISQQLAHYNTSQRAAASRSHGGAAQILKPNPQKGHNRVPFTHSLNQIGKYTIGLGMSTPTEMASNLAHPLRGRGPSHPQSYRASPSLGIVPWMPRIGTIKPAAWMEGGGGEIPKGPGMPKTNADLEKLAQGSPKLGPPTREEAQAAAQKKVSGSLMGERRAAARQRKAYKEARSEKFAKAQQAGEAAGGGIEGYKAELGQLKGELPRVKSSLTKLKNGEINQHDLEGLFRDIANHPGLSYGETLTGRRALMKAFEEGHALAPHEIAVLSRAFGQDAAEIMANKSFARKVGENALGILNFPRAIQAGIDFSFPGRQGIGVLAADPRIWLKGFPKQLHGFASEAYYQKMLDHLHQDPAFDLSNEAGVKYTELGRGATEREEPFATNILTNRPVKYNPIRAGARAYTLYGDYVRLELFKKYLAKAERQGVNIENKNELRDIARVVNTLSGRGGGKRLQQASPVANAVFFSPQLIASRLNMLNPAWYSRHIPVGPTSRFATRQAKLAGARFGLGAAGLIGGAAALGAKVQTDPRSADFAKLRLGNTRIDVLGGLQQYPRAAAQIASGKAISSTTGKTMTLGPGFGQMSRKDVAERFLASKFSPPASAAYEALQGKTYTGQPLSVRNSVFPRLTPLSMQDAVDVYKQTGSLPAALGGYGLSVSGVGVQSYGPRDVAKRAKADSDKLSQAFEQNLRKYYKIGVTPQIKKAINLRRERAIYLAQNTDKTTSPLDKYNVIITLMVKKGFITPKQAKGARTWAKTQNSHKLGSASRAISNKYFGGDVLTRAAKQIRDKGGDFYLGDY